MPSYRKVVLASAANKKRISRVTQISLICVVALFLFFSLYIFQLIPNPGFGNTSQKDIIKEQQLPGHISEGVSTPRSLVDAAFVKEIKLRLESIPNETVFKQSANDLLKAINTLLSDPAVEYSEEFGMAIEVKLKDASNLLEQIRVKIDIGFNRLEQAFDEKQLTPFMRELASLKRLAPEDARLTRWVGKENEVKILFEAYKQAQRYRAEQNLEKEIRAWENIVSLGYGDFQIAQRIAELNVQTEELAHEEHLKAARWAYEAENFNVARERIRNAIRLRPKSKSALGLKSAIDLAEKKRDARHFVQSAADKMSSDNWEGAATAFEKALKAMPLNTEAIQGRDIAATLLQDRAKLQQLVRNPIRLSDPEVHAYAEMALAESEKWEALSPSLRELRAGVKTLLEGATEKKDLVIESDGKAVIRVRGVGFVQPTAMRTIKLLPGTYELFAECLGHQTALYEVKIPMKGETKPVRVVCGERL